MIALSKSEYRNRARRTRLTTQQQAKLELLACDDPNTRVIGWHEGHQGPLLIRGDGSWATIRPTGRITGIV